MKEAYVKLETAKLLKEKGFDWECIGYYCSDEPKEVEFSLCGETNSTWEPRCYSAPTQQMACRWLRETYGLWVVPMPCLDGGCYFEIYKRYGKIWKNNVYDHIDYENFDEPEDAVEAALEYCLTNLI